MGDKNKVVICVMETASTRLQDQAASARHAAGFPLGVRGFPWFGGIRLFLKGACLFFSPFNVMIFFRLTRRRIHNAQPNLQSPILSAACVD